MLVTQRLCDFAGAAQFWGVWPEVQYHGTILLQRNVPYIGFMGCGSSYVITVPLWTFDGNYQDQDGHHSITPTE